MYFLYFCRVFPNFRSDRPLIILNRPDEDSAHLHITSWHLYGTIPPSPVKLRMNFTIYRVDGLSGSLSSVILNFLNWKDYVIKGSEFGSFWPRNVHDAHSHYFCFFPYTCTVHTVTSIKQSPAFKGPIKENIIWIEPLLGGHLSYKATFSFSQRCTWFDCIVISSL
jgi:hypothetical protein